LPGIHALAVHVRPENREFRMSRLSIGLTAPIRLAACAAALAPVLFMASPAQAQARSQPAQNYVEAGVLRCDVSAGIGLILGSTRQLDCTFEPRRGRTERYRGTIKRLGLDLGATTRGVMVWGVLAPSRVASGALAGSYVGASAGASAGVGLGANALVGGSNNSVALQPVSVQAQLGVNIAAGVAELSLTRVRR
jgi:hypothetical protein